MIQPRTTRRLRRLPAAGAIVFFTVAACGEETQTNAPLRLAVARADGSHIIGIPALTAFSVQTACAKMAIPVNHDGLRDKCPVRVSEPIHGRWKRMNGLTVAPPRARQSMSRSVHLCGAGQIETVLHDAHGRGAP